MPRVTEVTQDNIGRKPAEEGQTAEQSQNNQAEAPKPANQTVDKRDSGSAKPKK